MANQLKKLNLVVPIESVSIRSNLGYPFRSYDEFDYSM